MANITGRAFHPIRIPARWQEEERTLVRQIEDLFDRLFLGNYMARRESKLVKSMANAIYPVGCVYSSMDSTSPQTLFGGEWTSIATSTGYAWQRTKLWEG